MRILEECPDNMGWKTVQFCTGYGWDQGNRRPCGAKLEVADKDIRKRAYTDYTGCADSYYGFVCPICGCFTEISTRDIPLMARQFADKRGDYYRG